MQKLLFFIITSLCIQIYATEKYEPKRCARPESINPVVFNLFEEHMGKLCGSDISLVCGVHSFVVPDGTALCSLPIIKINPACKSDDELVGAVQKAVADALPVYTYNTYAIFAGAGKNFPGAAVNTWCALNAYGSMKAYNVGSTVPSLGDINDKALQAAAKTYADAVRIAVVSVIVREEE